MKLKKSMLYISNIILMYVLVLVINWFNTLSRKYFQRNFEINNLYFIITISIAMLLGALMAIEYLFNEFKKNGTWKVNVIKLIFVVIPLVLLSFSINIYYSNICSKLAEILLKVNASIPSYLIFSILCGYSLATSFYKIE